jgi:iron-sulfur cluster insertion protein
MISLTKIAVEKVKEISEAEGIGHYNIRVKIIGGGCAGFSQDMYYEDKISELDEVYEQDGVKVIIDPLSCQYLEDTVIDFLEGPMSAGFKFLNPNVKGSCGCGSSVSF